MRAWTNASRAFGALALLGVLSLLALAGILLLQGSAMAQGVWLACQNAAAAVSGYVPALGLLLPMLLLVVGLSRGAWSALAQLWHTRRLVAGLQAQVESLPAGLEAQEWELAQAGRLLLVRDESAYTFTQGLLRPRVWLSTGLVELLAADELAAVLRHERHHVQRGDPLRVLLSRCLAQALFFLPVAPALRDTYLVAKEVEADAACQSQQALAAALLKLLRHGARLPAGATLAAIGPVDATGARIERLLKGDSRPAALRQLRRHVWLSLVLALAVLLSSYASISRAAGPLEGGECGYTTWTEEQPFDATPANYTPVDLPFQ